MVAYKIQLVYQNIFETRIATLKIETMIFCIIKLHLYYFRKETHVSANKQYFSYNIY